MKVEELIKAHNDKDFIDNFINLFALKFFLNKCIISEKYNFKNLNIDSIALSPSGLELFDKLKKGKFSETDDELIKLAIFLDFYNSDLLIDVIKSDIESFSNSISAEIIQEKIIFPWIYGRTLYDKYFDEFEEQKKSLDNGEVLKLLENTPKGVFQMGNLVVGPLGILNSSTKRIIPPTRQVKLWHCSDPACTALHSVVLQTAETKITEISEEIFELTKEIESSEWQSFFNIKCEGENAYYDYNKIDDIPITLVYSFGENELRLVLKEILENKPNSREVLPNNRKLKGSADKIIKSLTKAECFQVVLLYDSSEIQFYTEKLISEKKIHIPATEIRFSTLQKSGGFLNIYHECNRLGFRTVSSGTHLSMVRLRNLILEIYKEPTLHQQLEWQLRFSKKETLIEKVEEYINQNEPRKIIRNTVLTGALQVNKTFEILHGYFIMPSTIEDEERIIDKILWKLGFNINIYPSFITTYEERLSKFQKIILDKSSYNESDKENIRSVAVNLFVSLEEILKHSLAFTTWLLLSDHLRATHFKYNYADATVFMTEILHGFKLSDETELEFDSKGRNTLFPLIEGFRALFFICDNYLSNSSEPYKRTKEELPFFAGKINLIDFPLNHKKLLFDIKTSSYLKVKEIGLKLSEDFSRNKVLSIRNALEHDREEFPLKSDLINACDCMKDSIEELKTSGLYPNVYLFESLVRDKFNRVLKTFEDYSGHKITISELINYKGYPVPSSKLPIVIVSTISFPESSEPLRIQYEENSEYLFYWKNYPRKKPKKINSENDD